MWKYVKSLPDFWLYLFYLCLLLTALGVGFFLNREAISLYYYFKITIVFIVPILMISYWVLLRDYKRFDLYTLLSKKYPELVFIERNKDLNDLSLDHFNIDEKPSYCEVLCGVRQGNKKMVLDYREERDPIFPVNLFLRLLSVYRSQVICNQTLFVIRNELDGLPTIEYEKNTFKDIKEIESFLFD
ncbi:MAG: hypothetical protein K9K67_12410 [Bacteriovoracaceae bacterium]|nr:hypothetical protein [Bacteriovoracaceae bacterium]